MLLRDRFILEDTLHLGHSCCTSQWKKCRTPLMGMFEWSQSPAMDLGNKEKGRGLQGIVSREVMFGRWGECQQSRLPS